MSLLNSVGFSCGENEVTFCERRARLGRFHDANLSRQRGPNSSSHRHAKTITRKMIPS
jgi:hypothetical protein